MGEAKRRRAAGRANGPSASAETVSFRPDYGQYLWDKGFRGEADLLNVRWGVITDYGDMREITGFVDLDETFCLTLRTKQSKDELIDLMGDPLHLAVGEVSETVDVGDSGENYRVLVGEISTRSA